MRVRLAMHAIRTLVALSLSYFAQNPIYAGVPELSAYSDDFVSLDIPSGWATSRILKDKMLLVDQDPSDSESAGILVRRAPGLGTADKASLARFLDTILDGRVRELSSQPLNVEMGTSIRYKDVTQDATIQVVSLPDPAAGDTVVIFFFATAEDFKTLSGEQTALRVAQSAISNQPAPPGHRFDRSGIVGTWEVSAKDVNLFSGPVSIALGGTASQARVTSSLSQSAWGTKLIYEFGSDGRFSARYKGLSVFGVMRSEIEAMESGRYELTSNTLTLRPAQYSGTISVGHQANSEKMHKSKLPARTYRMGLDGDLLALIGPCADYQVEPNCGTSSEPNASAIFPLVHK